jgi:hypothetical protein
MRWELVKLWVNRVGILLEFLSFWFAAPEILGKERLSALEQRSEQWIKQLPIIMIGPLGWVIYVGSLMVLFRQELRTHEGVKVLVVLLLVTVLVILLLLWMARKVMALVSKMSLKRLTWKVLVIVVVPSALVVAAAFYVWHSEMETGLQRGAGFYWVLGSVTAAPLSATGSVLALFLHDRLVQPLLRALADDACIRQRSLAVGAVLFVVGFLLQLIATF